MSNLRIVNEIIIPNALSLGQLENGAWYKIVSSLNEAELVLGVEHGEGVFIETGIQLGDSDCKLVEVKNVTITIS